MTHRNRSDRARRLLLLSVMCGTLGCSGATAPSGDGIKLGSLSITVTVPNGVTPTVTVTGPSGYSKALASTQTLTNLPVGSYTVTAATGLTADSIVSIGYGGTVTGSPASVTANATATATVTYAQPWSSSGVLWVASTLGYSLSGYTATQLRTTGAPTPAISIGSDSSTSVIQGASALQVDQTGGLWIANNNDTLYYYAATQLAHSTTAGPVRKLVSSLMSEASALAIDNSGNLWVADQGAGKIFEFTATQLAAGGNASPSVTLSSALGSISRPFSMTFDAHGDLWVCNYGDSTVVGFSPTQLQTTGAPIPYAGLTGARGTTNNVAIQFDAQGNLWVANLLDTLVEYTPDQLTSIGSPTPPVVIALQSHGGQPGFIQEPGPMAFDNSGALWIADVQQSKLSRFLPTQLSSGANPVPAVTIGSSGSGTHAAMSLPFWITFSPHAAGLPSN